MTSEELKQGMFRLGTRRFSIVTELMIKSIKQFGESQNMFHDLYDRLNNVRVEVKFSVVRANLNPMTTDNILEGIQHELEMDREVPFLFWEKFKFGCNIQQVKKSEFDVLYYGLFFDDCIKIFRIDPINIDGEIGYSDKQHKGNVGEGQFHITHKNLRYHLDNFYQQTISYEELLCIINDNKRSTLEEFFS